MINKSINIKLLLLVLLLFSDIVTGHAQNRFFRQYWMEYDSRVNNTNASNRPERPRVGDLGMSTHPDHWSRTEAQVNGLIMINIPDTIKNIDHSELYLELWGGHPGTALKRFQINGGKIYYILDKPTAENNCEYHYPLIPVDYKELVRGNNAIQFGCDRGTAFWGHYIIDQLAVRCYLRPDDPILLSPGFKGFSAIPVIKSKSKIVGDNVELLLEFSDSLTNLIERVHYFARYEGYNDNGSDLNNCWHGYTHDRVFKGHIGTSIQPPFAVLWSTRMIPDQSGPMALKALVEFKNGLFCWSDVLDGLTFPLKRPTVGIFYCNNMPLPFWSRNNQLKRAEIELPADISKIESAELHIRIWDGGEGKITEPFKLNGVPFKISTGKAVHDLVYTVNNVNPEDLNPGQNSIQLLSDTEHHGIEVCWPGPALIVRFKE